MSSVNAKESNVATSSGSALRPLLALCLAACCIAGKPAPADDFYKGRTITVICGFTVGGGYDAYARMLARHIGEHIAGKPSVVVQNMDGAGSLRASNYVYANAAKDGTVIAAVNQNMPMFQLLGGKAAQFEAGRLQWIGSLISANGAIYTWHTSPTKTIEDSRRRETPLGGAGTTSDSHIYPTLLNRIAGTRFKVINGYPGGTRSIHIAMERGEVEGRSGGGTIPSLIANNKDWLDQKKLNFLVQIGQVKEPEMGDAPLMGELVSTDEDRSIVDLVTMPIILGYAYWLAPEVPAERIEVLRKAFDEMLVSPAFRAEAEKIALIIRPQPGRALASIVARASSVPKPVRERAAQLLDWKE